MSNIIKNPLMKILKNDGPWGSYNGGGNNSGNNKGSGQNNNGGEDFDEIVRKTQEFLKGFFGGGNSKNNGSKSPNSKNTPPTRSIVGIFALGIITLWLATGIYKVNPDENAVILYFGKYYSIATPGLNYSLPAPISKVIKKSVTKVNTEEFISGVASDTGRGKSFGRGYYSRNKAGESLMLTGDENIVDIDFQIQWQISDIKSFVLNITDQAITIKKAAESSMREIIAKTPIADALSDGKRRVEQETKDLLQKTLDSYGAGIRIVLVQMRRVDPPKQVIDAFRDVQTAKADKEREINQAEAYENDIIPKARGNAAQLVQQAQAYEKEVVADAQGQAKRFLSVYYQYIRAKAVTRKRIYLETMEKIYKDMDKVIIDSSATKSGVVPYLPLNELKK